MPNKTLFTLNVAIIFLNVRQIRRFTFLAINGGDVKIDARLCR